MNKQSLLVVNSGSSSLKYSLLNLKRELILKGHIDGIGLKSCKIHVDDKTWYEEIKDHTQAIEFLLNHIKDHVEGLISIGHRVVHGGEHFSKATIIDTQVIKRITQLCDLAPLHNPANLLGIQACLNAFPLVPQVAVFDTAFHSTIPEERYLYGLPYEMYQDMHIRKYGFHGTNHKYVSNRANELLSKDLKLISCHLGNGASVCAIKEGKSVDTSMGFTPLQGLVMGTRSGDLDPEIVKFLCHHLDAPVDKVLTVLNKESGLKGLSGDSDMRVVFQRTLKNDEKAKRALKVFEAHLLHYIGAYEVLLEGADAIAFTGGIGEGAWYVREWVANHLKHLGVKLDQDANINHKLIISAPDSSKTLLVIPAGEEEQIAFETYEAIKP